MRSIKIVLLLALSIQTSISATEVTIICTGDIIPGSMIMPSPPFKKTSRFRLKNNTFRYVSHILKRGDITIGNLEGPIGYDGLKIIDKGFHGYSFRFAPGSAKILRHAGFTALNLANNHTFDCTGEGLYETYLDLYRSGILSVGLYKLPWHIPELPHAAQWTMPIQEVKGLKAALLGFSSREVFKSINYTRECIDVISSAKEKADLCIVTFHGGAELSNRAVNRTEYYLEERRGNTIAFSRAAIDAGADLVFGHGPHVLRGMEFYKGKLIAYSLGNFCDLGLMKYIYPDNENIQKSVILEVVLNERGNYLRAKIYPVTTAARGIPKTDTKQRGIQIINFFSR